MVAECTPFSPYARYKPSHFAVIRNHIEHSLKLYLEESITVPIYQTENQLKPEM